VQSSESFVKVLTSPSDYIARGVLELPDGSLLLPSVSSVPQNFNVNNSLSSGLPSVLTKMDALGELLWQIELPETVQFLWHCRLLKNGNIIAVGFNSDENSEQIGLVTLNQEGTILNQFSIFNSSRSLPSSYGDKSVDCIVLQNGNIALAVPHSLGSNIPLIPRLLVFSPELVKVFDRRYASNALVPTEDVYQLYLSEDLLGNIVLNGRNQGADTLTNFAFMVELEASSYVPQQFQLFQKAGINSPASLVLSNAGNWIWTSSGTSEPDTLLNYWFNFRNQEKFPIGPSIALWQTNNDFQNSITKTIDGYPKNGYISTIKKCTSGGFILLGTCNINENQQIPSEYRVLMIKLTEDLNIEWIQTPNTNGPSIGSDIIETEAGYLVSATHISLGEFSQPIVFKTDVNGIIK
jgi:hypothetical protein